MSTKFQTYFGQIITDTELNEIFDSFVSGIEQFVQDFNYSGIAAGGVVTQHTPLNLSVDIAAPTVVYDQAANRISFGSPVNVNVAVDENSASTAPSASGKSKVLSIFIKFVSTPADPRTDDLGATVYFREIGGYQLNVAAGAESSGTPAPVALRGDQILLADVTLAYGQTTISTANINLARAQAVFQLSGSPLSITSKGLAPVLQHLLDQLNTLTIATVVDATTLIVPLLTGSPVALSSGSLTAVLTALLAAFNTRATIVDKLQVSSTSPGDVEYVTPISRQKTLNIFAGQIHGSDWSAGAPGTPYLTCTVNNGLIYFPVELPAGCLVTAVRLSAHKGAAGADQMTFGFSYLAPMNFTLSINPPPTDHNVGYANSSGGASDGVWQAGTWTALSTPSPVIVAGQQYYVFVVGSPSAGANNDLLYGVQVRFTDPTGGGR